MDIFTDIAQTYDWTEQSTDDIPFYIDLAGEADGAILELGAGTGRITIPISKLGKPVTALDISYSMLSQAKAKAASDNIHFVLGDFRTLSFNHVYDLILAPGRVFEHALSDAERLSAFTACASHLKQAGAFALHVWGAPADMNPRTPQKTNSIDQTDEHGNLLFSSREERDFVSKIRRHYFRIIETDGQKRTWTHNPIKVRWYTANELDTLGQAVGMTVQNRFQDFHGKTYKDGSPNMIWVYQKK
jgi:SAM-dependent methyltransferase